MVPALMVEQHWMHASSAGFQLVTAMPGDVRGCDVHMQLRPGAHTGQPAAEGHGWPTGEASVTLPLVVWMHIAFNNDFYQKHLPHAWVFLRVC